MGGRLVTAPTGPKNSILRSNLAYAMSIAQAHAPTPAPPISFRRLAARVVRLPGAGQLMRHLPDAELGRAVELVSAFEDAHADALGTDEALAGTVAQISQAVDSGTWSSRGAARRVITNLVVWSILLWSVEEVGGVAPVVGVTPGVVIPAWAAQGRAVAFGAMGIGAAAAEAAARFAGRSRGVTIAQSLGAVGGCRMWLTPIALVLVPGHGRRDVDWARQLVVDAVPRSEISRIERVVPRFTMLRQMRLVFSDGSKARFLYSGKAATFDTVSAWLAGARGGDDAS